MIKSEHRVEDYFQDESTRKKPLRNLWIILLIAATILGLAFIVQFLGISYQKSTPQTAIPLIESENTNYKVKIQNDDETKIANLDKEFFSNITKSKVIKNEKILPVAEEAIDKATLEPENKPEQSKEKLKEPVEILVAQEKNLEKSQEVKQQATPPVSAFAILDQEDSLKDMTNETLPAQLKPEPINTSENSLKVATNNPKAKKLLQDIEIVETTKISEDDKFRLQIATFNSKKDVMEYLNYLKAKKASGISELPHKIEQKTIQGKGIFYRLQLGAFTNKDDAKKTCKRLKENKIDCFVISPE